MGRLSRDTFWRGRGDERIMATGPGDATPENLMYRGGKPGGYDSRCSCCWLNIGHTVALHERNIGEHDPTTSRTERD